MDVSVCCVIKQARQRDASQATSRGDSERSIHTRKGQLKQVEGGKGLCPIYHT